MAYPNEGFVYVHKGVSLNVSHVYSLQFKNIRLDKDGSKLIDFKDWTLLRRMFE